MNTDIPSEVSISVPCTFGQSTFLLSWEKSVCVAITCLPDVGVQCLFAHDDIT